MEHTVAIASIEQISKQRNLFLTLSLVLATSSLALSIKLFKSDEKVVMVPGISQEVWTKEGGVSRSYLEETTLMYLPQLLDLDAGTIDYKAGIIFKYISQDDPKYMKKIQSYFAKAKAKYKKFKLSTYFSIKNLQIDSKDLVVVANGTLASRYGDKGFETKNISYQLSYQWLGGHLRLKEFVRLKSKEELDLEEAKRKQIEQKKLKSQNQSNQANQVNAQGQTEINDEEQGKDESIDEEEEEDQSTDDDSQNYENRKVLKDLNNPKQDNLEHKVINNDQRQYE